MNCNCQFDMADLQCAHNRWFCIDNETFSIICGVSLQNPNNVKMLCIELSLVVVVVIDLPLLRVAVEGSDNPVSLEKPCQASLPPDQQGRHSLGRHPEVQYVA